MLERARRRRAASSLPPNVTNILTPTSSRWHRRHRKFPQPEGRRIRLVGAFSPIAERRDGLEVRRRFGAPGSVERLRPQNGRRLSLSGARQAIAGDGDFHVGAAWLLGLGAN